ncbi:hypothetical protein [Caproicibacter sp. BJN0012]|uniref:hypothetical protein n=1 Tax=Caproicibacter sp. BJN0012 TaxID=3110227 RepID=UPI002E111DC7
MAGPRADDSKGAETGNAAGASRPEVQKQLDFFAVICKNEDGGTRCVPAVSVALKIHNRLCRGRGRRCLGKEELI